MSASASARPVAAGGIRVLLVDRHPVVRRGIEVCLAQAAMSAEAGDVNEAIERGVGARPHVAILDDASIPDATRRLKNALPETEIVVFTVDGDGPRIRQAVNSGARGYVLKTASPEELVKAVETIHSGSPYFSPRLSTLLVTNYVKGRTPSRIRSQLSRREIEVLERISEGATSREIAERLRLSIRTVVTHREHIMRKLDIHTVAGLTRFAIACGIVEPE